MSDHEIVKEASVDLFLRAGATVEIGFHADVEPVVGTVMDHNHIGLLLLRAKDVTVVLYPWHAIRRVT